jgi:hypothetical protein
MNKDGMDDPGRRERITLQQPIEESPDETTLAIAATEPLTPAAGNRAAEIGQRGGIPGDSVIRIVSTEFLTNRPMLFADRLVPVPSAPLGDAPHRPR